MKTWVKRSLNMGALTAGALLVAANPAQADPTMVSAGNTGAASGVQALLPVQAPINICGNALTASGVAFAGCEGGASALDREWTFERFREESGPVLTSLANSGIGSGSQVFAPVQAPINVCGNAVALLGSATAGCEGGADAERERPAPDKRHDHGKRHRDRPGYGEKGEKRGGHDARERDRKPRPHHGHRESHRGAHRGGDAGPTLISAGNSGALAGSQIFAPIQIPINICGLAIGGSGFAVAGCEGGATATSER